MLCELAIYEWLSSNCLTCNGARELVIGEKRVICDTCKGTGLRRHKDRDRAGYLKVSMATIRKGSKNLQRIHGVIGKYDSAVNSVLNQKLKEIA